MTAQLLNEMEEIYRKSSQLIEGLSLFDGWVKIKDFYVTGTMTEHLKYYHGIIFDKKEPLLKYIHELEFETPTYWKVKYNNKDAVNALFKRALFCKEMSQLSINHTFKIKS